MVYHISQKYTPDNSSNHEHTTMMTRADIHDDHRDAGLSCDGNEHCALDLL